MIMVESPADYESVRDKMTKETVNMYSFQVVDVTKNIVIQKNNDILGHIDNLKGIHVHGFFRQVIENKLVVGRILDHDHVVELVAYPHGRAIEACRQRHVRRKRNRLRQRYRRRLLRRSELHTRMKQQAEQ